MAKKLNACKTKNELVKELINQSNFEMTQAQSKEVIDSLFTILHKSIKTNKRFVVSGFGTFKLKERKARTGINPITKEKIKIKKSKTITFKPAPKIKEKL